MSTERINVQYLRSFFAIADGPKGDAEIEEICKKLIKQQFSHGQDICTIDGEADGISASTRSCPGVGVSQPSDPTEKPSYTSSCRRICCRSSAATRMSTAS